MNLQVLLFVLWLVGHGDASSRVATSAAPTTSPATSYQAQLVAQQDISPNNMLDFVVELLPDIIPILKNLTGGEKNELQGLQRVGGIVKYFIPFLKKVMEMDAVDKGLPLDSKRFALIDDMVFYMEYLFSLLDLDIDTLPSLPTANSNNQLEDYTSLASDVSFPDFDLFVSDESASGSVEFDNRGNAAQLTSQIKSIVDATTGGSSSKLTSQIQDIVDATSSFVSRVQEPSPQTKGHLSQTAQSQFRPRQRVRISPPAVRPVTVTRERQSKPSSAVSPPQEPKLRIVSKPLPSAVFPTQEPSQRIVSASSAVFLPQEPAQRAVSEASSFAEFSTQRSPQSTASSASSAVFPPQEPSQSRATKTSPSPSVSSQEPVQRTAPSSLSSAVFPPQEPAQSRTSKTTPLVSSQQPTQRPQINTHPFFITPRRRPSSQSSSRRRTQDKTQDTNPVIEGSRAQSRSQRLRQRLRQSQRQRKTQQTQRQEHTFSHRPTQSRLRSRTQNREQEQTSKTHEQTTQTQTEDLSETRTTPSRTPVFGRKVRLFPISSILERHDKREVEENLSIYELPGQSFSFSSF